MAAGHDWHGHCVEQGGVLYLSPRARPGCPSASTPGRSPTVKVVEQIRFLPVPLLRLNTVDAAAFTQALPELPAVHAILGRFSYQGSGSHPVCDLRREVSRK